MNQLTNQISTEEEWVDFMVNRAKKRKNQFGIARVLGSMKVWVFEPKGRINFFLTQMEDGSFEMNARCIKNGFKNIQSRTFYWSEGIEKTQLEVRIKEMERQMDEQIARKTP